MIVQLGESALLSRLQWAFPFALVLAGALSALQLDPRSVFLFVAAAFLRRTLLQLDPQGLLLHIGNDGYWRIHKAGNRAIHGRVLRSRGTISELVWLEYARGIDERRRASLLILPDAVDGDSYRALRRALKTQSPASP